MRNAAASIVRKVPCLTGPKRLRRSPTLGGAFRVLGERSRRPPLLPGKAQGPSLSGQCRPRAQGLAAQIQVRQLAVAGETLVLPAYWLVSHTTPLPLVPGRGSGAAPL